MTLSASTLLRRLVLLTALALGSCGGGSVGDAPGASGDALGGGTTVGSDIGSGGTGITGGGTGVASGGVGSGGTGVSGGSGGVGSGGTGATADAGIGSIDGFGSIIVNGVRYDISTATTMLSDVSALKLGMTVRVTGSLSADLTQGTATLVTSAADLRGKVSNLSAAGGTFTVLGVQVSTDPATVYAGGLMAFSGLANGVNVQVHGLPGAGGRLQATRIERLATAQDPVLTGYVQDLDRAAHVFRIGTQSVSYATADFPGDWPWSRLAEGQVVRVRAAAVASTLAATAVEPWNPAPLRDGTRLSLGGLVTDYEGLQSLRIDGVPADLSAVRLTSLAGAMANGARVDATGTMQGGVLQVSTVRVRQAAPTTTASAPPAEQTSFTARGSVGAYRSPSNFKVQGQDVDASAATYVGGTAADLGPGRKVLVTGSRVRDDVLAADQVEFLN
ncbi:DUF5666 domain-containing protein [Ramlibacter sp. MMS24-I3-19]|uniref:DUF5666 domain-containing protein n=1 Tax=Ramlibacter sp. MMS24-I3-19 TaxID=3416606 RepID=UPI003CFF308E